MLFDTKKIQQLLGLSSPIIAGMLSQNVLNLVDTAMVGRLGAESIAAVGISGMVAFLYQSPVLGISSAVQAIAARRKGEGKDSELAYSLDSALVYAFLFAIIIIASAFWLAEPIFQVITHEEGVREISQSYFLIRVCACFFTISNYAFRGYWNAINESKIYMNTLFAMHATNIFLNYCLIFGKFGMPRLEANGAALATSLSIALGFFIYFITAFFKARKHGFLKYFPSQQQIWDLSKISLPAGFEFFITMSNVTALYWLVGKIGTASLAACNILMNILLVTLLPALGFGMGLATLAGQALGRGDKEEAYEWGWHTARFGFVLFVLMALPFFFIPEKILYIFTHDQSVIDTGKIALKIMGLTLGFEMMTFIFAEALKSLGSTPIVTKISFTAQWLCFFPIACILVFVFKLPLLFIWIAQSVMHISEALIYILIWKKRNWQDVQV